LSSEVIGGLRQTWGPDVPIDLVSCFAALPAGFDPATTRVYRVSDYRGREGRGRLYRLLGGPTAMRCLGIVCSGEPLMTKWKWALALRIPAKVFVINENGDYFWLDRVHFGLIRQFVLLRAGLAEAGAVRMLAQSISFPFTFLYLLLYAALGTRAARIAREDKHESHSSIRAGRRGEHAVSGRANA
jgi:hypothetical protein